MAEEETETAPDSIEEIPNAANLFITFMQGLRDAETNLDSPVDISLSLMTEIQLPELVWCNYEVVPKKNKFKNNGFTAILSAKYFEDRPFIYGGPLIGSYVFSQVHFHWGCTDLEGSEHTVDGSRLPVEMHVVHYKNSYISQESALLEKDGIVIVVYFFKLESKPDPYIQVLLDEFENITEAESSIKLLPALPLHMLLKPFGHDYFIYWGNIETSTKFHDVLWIISRTPFSISGEQTEIFRTLNDVEENQIIRNFRELKYDVTKKIYHVNPSESKCATFLPVIFGRDL